MSHDRFFKGMAERLERAIQKAHSSRAANPDAYMQKVRAQEDAQREVEAIIERMKEAR